MENNENMIEFLAGARYAVVSFTNKKHISRIKSIYEERKDDFKYFVENEDGSICAKIPLKWIKVNPGSASKRHFTDEQLEAMKERMAKAREAKQVTRV